VSTVPAPSLLPSGFLRRPVLQALMKRVNSNKSGEVFFSVHDFCSENSLIQWSLKNELVFIIHITYLK
jgi:hypothetical protein